MSVLFVAKKASAFMADGYGFPNRLEVPVGPMAMVFVPLFGTPTKVALYNPGGGGGEAISGPRMIYPLPITISEAAVSLSNLLERQSRYKNKTFLKRKKEIYPKYGWPLVKTNTYNQK